MAVSSHQTVGRGEVLWRSTLGGVLVRVPGADEVVKLAGTGAAMWAELASPRSFGDLCAALAVSHDADAERIAADLRPVVADLADRAVVHVDG